MDSVTDEQRSRRARGAPTAWDAILHRASHFFHPVYLAAALAGVFKQPLSPAGGKRPSLIVGRVGLLALALAVPGAVEASRTVNFGSTLNATNVQSDGSPMDVTFTFSLGVFASIVPDAGNVDLWAADWTALQNATGDPAEVLYDPSPLGAGDAVFVNNFEGSAWIDENVSDPASPYVAGTQAYIWGFTSREVGVRSEWVLISNAAWILPVVPDDGQPSPFALDWAVSDGGTFAILGSTNPDYATAGDAPHLQSASVMNLPVAVPEPSGFVLVFAGAAVLAIARRRRLP